MGEITDMALNGTKVTDGKEPVLVVLQLSGGNDFMNTVVPYGDPLYYDFRKTVGVSEEDALHIDSRVGFHPVMTEIKSMFDQGDVAVIQGIGYPEPDRSHFRSMDIWHTAQPHDFSDEGWLGRVIREIDPGKKSGEQLPARYTLQVGSFPSLKQAQRSLRELEKGGVEAFMSASDVPDKGKVYRVRVGKFHSADEARQFQAEFKRQRDVEAFVMPL